MTWKQLKDLARKKGVRDDDEVEVSGHFHNQDVVALELLKLRDGRWRICPVEEERESRDIGR